MKWLLSFKYNALLKLWDILQTSTYNWTLCNFLWHNCISSRDWYGKKIFKTWPKEHFCKNESKPKKKVSLELLTMFFHFWGKLSTPKKGQLSHRAVMESLWLCWTACSQPKSIQIGAFVAVQVTQKNMLVTLLLGKEKVPFLSKLTAPLSCDNLEEHLWA